MERLLGPTPGVSDLVSPPWSLRIVILSKSPGDTDGAGSQTTV